MESEKDSLIKSAVVSTLKPREKPEPPKPPPRDCMRCKFMTVGQMPPPQLGTEYLCYFGPPSLTILVQIDKRGNIGTGHASGFPRVNPGNWCWQFVEKGSDNAA
jgi:hypothetical protein